MKMKMKMTEMTKYTRFWRSAFIPSFSVNSFTFFSLMTSLFVTLSLVVDGYVPTVNESLMDKFRL